MGCIVKFVKMFFFRYYGFCIYLFFFLKDVYVNKINMFNLMIYFMICVKFKDIVRVLRNKNKVIMFVKEFVFRIYLLFKEGGNYYRIYRI